MWVDEQRRWLRRIHDMPNVVLYNMVSNMARTKAETWFCFQTPEGGVLEEEEVLLNPLISWPLLHLFIVHSNN